MADSNNHLVRRIDQFGFVTTISGLPKPELRAVHTSSSSPIRLQWHLHSNESAVIVTDRHRIRRVSLNDLSVTAVVGGGNEGNRDGDGSESTLNNPSSIAITGDGVAYVADSASCRIRRVGSTSMFAATHALCTDSLPSIMRPNGCSSYNSPIDEYGLAATPVEGNVHYNYQYKHEFDIDLGHDFTR